MNDVLRGIHDQLVNHRERLIEDLATCNRMLEDLEKPDEAATPLRGLREAAGGG